ncbi:MAG: hypothetical protein IJW60_03675 [Clostridia bacterium]|nr:hypothetical protein [Clostridia bacterium]
MKRTIRTLLLTLCTMLFAVCAAFAAACNVFTLDLKSPERPFRVGDSVNCYDFIDREIGVEYTFEVQKDGTDENGAAYEKETVSAQTYYVGTAGKYTLFCTAKKGSLTATDSVVFEVKEIEPFLLHYGTLKLPLASKYSNSMLIRRMSPVVLSETASEQYFTQVTVYKDFGENSETYDLTNGNVCRYYDGSKHLFMDEGKYIYHFVVENAGGKKEKDIPVEVREDFTAMSELTKYTLSYDEGTMTVTWDEVEKASYYRVRVDEQIVTVKEGRTLNIQPYFVEEFQYFQLEVAAIAADEERIGKIVGEYVCVAPTGYEDVVLSEQITIDKATRTATMPTVEVWGRSESHVDEYAKEYVAFAGEYGVGTYVDFEFTGNNMPTVRFFANDIDCYLTDWEKRDTTTNGLILMSGYQSQGSGSINGDQLNSYRIYGPNGLVQGYLDSKSANMLANLSYSDYPLLSMQGRMDNPLTQFKYTVGTRQDGGDNTLIAHIMLSTKVDGAWVQAYNLEIDTNLSVEEFEAGHIVAIAPIVKETTTSFAFSKPYEYQTNAPESMYRYNTEFLSDTSVVMNTRVAYSRNIHDIYGEQDAYVAFKEDYGVGHFVDISFKGNNLPNVRFFANKVNGYIANVADTVAADNTGLLFSSGLATRSTNSNYTSAYYVAPNMITTRYDLINSFNALNIGYWMPYLTQAKLAEDENAEYKYTVGTLRDTDGTVLAIAYLYKKNGAAWEIVGNTAFDTDKTVEAWETSGKKIVIVAPIKGVGKSEFTFTQPYTKQATDSDLVGQRAVWDEEGNVVLQSKYVSNSSTANIDANEQDASYIAYTGDYGVGTYLDFEFKGNNMPQVRFFASSVDGLITKYEDDTEDVKTWQYSADTSGLLFTNGCVNGQHAVEHSQNQFFRVYYDMLSNGWLGWPPSDAGGGYVFEYPADKSVLSTLGMRDFAANPDVDFKVTVGTYQDTDGTTMIHLIVKAKVNGLWKLVSEQTYDTGIAATDYGTGSIVVLSAMKGANETTVFKCSGPYQK